MSPLAGVAAPRKTDSAKDACWCFHPRSRGKGSGSSAPWPPGSMRHIPVENAWRGPSSITSTVTAPASSRSPPTPPSRAHPPTCPYRSTGKTRGRQTAVSQCRGHADATAATATVGAAQKPLGTGLRTARVSPASTICNTPRDHDHLRNVVVDRAHRSVFRALAGAFDH